jgi:dipeptidyl aminopeptidase/acylaminoacyl peptidase
MAHLYIPNGLQGQGPAVLSPLGHARNGKSYRSYQYASQTLAGNGYVVLTFDPFGHGKRQRYFDIPLSESAFRLTW